jgi:hypothetical protein
MAKIVPFEDGPFSGLNAYPSPERLRPGELTLSDNWVNDGGALVARPGKRAQLNAALGNGIYASHVYTRTDGSIAVLFAVGNGSIYLWERDGAMMTQIAALGAYDAPSVRFAQVGVWVYICGATDGKLRRTNLTTHEVAEVPTKPAYKTTATLINRVLAPMSNAASWAIDKVVSPDIALADNNFLASSTVGVDAGSLLSTAWRVTSGTVEVTAGDGAYSADNFVRLDEPGSGILSEAYYAVPVKSNTFGVGSTPRRAIHFAHSAVMTATTADDTIIVRLLAYDASDNPLAELTEEVSPTVGQKATFHTLFSFAGIVDDTQIATVRIGYQAGKKNAPGGTNGAYLSLAFLSAVCADTAYIGQDPTQGVYVRAFYASGVALSDGTLPLGDIRLVYDLGAATDYSTKTQIALSYYEYFAIDENVPVTCRLGLRSGLTTQVYETAILRKVSADDGSVYLVADLSTILAANRNAVRYVELHFTDDAKFKSRANSGEAPFRIGPLAEAGNLSPSRLYRWRVMEVDARGFTSPAGVASLQLTTTSFQAIGNLVNGLGVTNAGARLRIGRQGGTFEDAYYREVAEFDPAADAAGTDWTWSAATKTFVDNVRDLDLLDADVLSFHDATPRNVSALLEWQGRLAAVTADGLYLSDLTAGDTAGMYWRSVAVASAADFAIQGTLFPKRYRNTGPTILIPFLTRLWWFSGPDICVLSGDGADNWELDRFVSDEGLGPVGGRAALVWEGKIWFVASDGLRSIAGVPVSNGTVSALRTERESLPLKGLFTGSADAVLWFHEERLFVTSPLPGQASIGAAFLRDTVSGSWHRWLLGEVTGAFVIAGELYITDAGGQVYAVGAVAGGLRGDTATRAGATLPVGVSVQGRTFFSDGRALRAGRLWAVLEQDIGAADLAVSIVVGASADGDVIEETIAYTLGDGQTRISRLGVDYLRGQGLYWRITANTSGALRLLETTLTTSRE